MNADGEAGESEPDWYGDDVEGAIADEREAHAADLGRVRAAGLAQGERVAQQVARAAGPVFDGAEALPRVCPVPLLARPAQLQYDPSDVDEAWCFLCETNRLAVEHEEVRKLREWIYAHYGVLTDDNLTKNAKIMYDTAIRIHLPAQNEWERRTILRHVEVHEPSPQVDRRQAKRMLRALAQHIAMGGVLERVGEPGEDGESEGRRTVRAGGATLLLKTLAALEQLTAKERATDTALQQSAGSADAQGTVRKRPRI